MSTVVKVIIGLVVAFVALTVLAVGCIAMVGSELEDQQNSVTSTPSPSPQVSPKETPPGSGELPSGGGVDDNVTAVGEPKLTNPHGYFEGTLPLQNHTDETREVLVTLTLFSGDQQVGELIGNITMKPNSKATVSLTSLDEYTRKWTDYTVDITAF